MMYFESDSIKDHSNELRLPDQPSPPSAAYHRHLPSPIRPPTPLTPSSSLSTADISSNSSSNNCNYSLFQRDISAPSLDCWNSILRKHSVANDGADFKVSSTFTPVSSMDAAATATASTVGCSTPSVWRRQSTPNTHSSCLLCSHRSCNLQPCGHAICLACLASLPFASMACPVCLQSTLETQILARQEWDQADRMIAGLQPNPQHFLAPAPAYPCAKLTNIPWDVSQNDIRNFFSNCRIPSLSIHAQAIHIMMDRTTGKTLSDAYVEFSSHDELLRAIETRHQKPLKGRIVTVTECPQEELLKVVFPKWRGQFYGISAIPPASEVVKNMSTAAGGGSNACPPFVTREEINSLLVVCKNYKLHFSRKCAERPFENIISIIAKYPWHQVHLISPMHRDHVYEMLKLSIESLKTHLSKDYVQIDPTLLQRLTRAGIMCPAFTDRQKMTLLQTARIDCPTDLLHHFVPSASDYYQLALLNKPSPLSSSARSNEFLFASPPVPYTDMLYQPASPTHPTSRNNGGGAVTSAAIVSPTIRARVPRSSDCDKRILTV